jgi:hypothetical protein
MPTTLALFLALFLGTQSMASETSSPATEWVEDTVDFGTDSYDEDGCFC